MILASLGGADSIAFRRAAAVASRSSGFHSDGMAIPTPASGQSTIDQPTGMGSIAPAGVCDGEAWAIGAFALGVDRAGEAIIVGAVAAVVAGPGDVDGAVAIALG
jgi:hypothetical protein